MDPKEELPSLLWGLDPVFSAFARLYIKDILEMTESYQVPGIYFYNSHPISKVDVLGTVVYKRERDDFFCYGVDDSTGVINCLCWKDDPIKDEVDEEKSGRTSADGAEGGFNLAAELRKLRASQLSQGRLEIGELLRVRGQVKTSRQQREIKAYTYYKVDDPVMAEQIEWMMEVPQLYRVCYDKPPSLHPSAPSESVVTPLSKATNIIKDFLKQKSVTKFRPFDVLELLESLVSPQPQTSAAAEQEAVAGPSGVQQLQQLLKDALQILQDEGVVYRKVRSQDQVYFVTVEDKDLLMAVKDIIREDSKRGKYAEKGCHILHILSAVRHRYSLNVSKAALGLVLKSLECNSDIISTCDNYYTVL